jgi:hypothetical protein
MGTERLRALQVCSIDVASARPLMLIWCTIAPDIVYGVASLVSLRIHEPTQTDPFSWVYDTYDILIWIQVNFSQHLAERRRV